MKRWTLWLGILLLSGLTARAGTLVEFRTVYGSIVVGGCWMRRSQ